MIYTKGIASPDVIYPMEIKLRDDYIRDDQIANARRIQAGQTTYDSFHKRRREEGKNKKQHTNHGHEAFLKQLETSKAEIRIVTTAGEVFSGVVKHSDKYTVSIRSSEEEGTVVFFKHAIERFHPTEPAPKRGEPDVSIGLND